MSSEMPSFYSFKMGECINKWKKVIFVSFATVLLFLVVLLVIVATGADNGAVTATVFGRKEFAQALTKPYGKVSGVTTLNKAFNLLSGRGFDTSYANSIGEFTTLENKMVTLSGTTSYEPDQISIVANPTCDYYHEVSEEYIAGSISIEAIQAKQFSFGGDLYLIEDAIFGAGNAGDEFSNKSPMGTQLSIMYGNTQITAGSLAAKGALFTHEFCVRSGARLLTAAVDWVHPNKAFNFNKYFISDMKSLGKKMSARERNKRVMKFINKYGTHVIERAEFGAYCFADIVIAQGAVEVERKAFISNSSNFNAMTSFGFYSASNSYSVGVAQKSSFGFNYQIASVGCDGLLKANPCDINMQSGVDEPVMFRGEPKWIFDINISGNNGDESASADSKSANHNGRNGKINYNVYKTLYQYFKLAEECRVTECNGVGYCVPDTNFWDYGLYIWDGTFDDYSTFFKSGVCISD